MPCVSKRNSRHIGCAGEALATGGRLVKRLPSPRREPLLVRVRSAQTSELKRAEVFESDPGTVEGRAGSLVLLDEEVLRARLLGAAENALEMDDAAGRLQ